MKLNIEVTQADIDRGVPSSLDKCPIARAAARAGIINVEVGSSVMYGTYGFKPFMAFLPQTAQEFVDRFDREVSVSPFEFVIVWGMDARLIEETVYKEITV